MSELASGSGGGPTDRPLGPRAPFFEIYKRGQGVQLRGWTALVAGLLIAGGAYSIHDRLESIFSGETWSIWVRVLAAVAWLIALGVLAFWLIGKHRKCADFLIATEGEMKKVSWTTKRELIGSTKVVIVATVLLGAILFVVDVAFMAFFTSIGVLKGPPVLEVILGGTS